MAEAVIDTKELANQLTLTVTMRNVRQWQWRLKIACLLIRLAAWVMWVNVEFVDKSQDAFDFWDNEQDDQYDER